MNNYEAMRYLEYRLLEQRRKLVRICDKTYDRNLVEAIEKINTFLELLASVKMSRDDWGSGYRHVKVAINDSLLASLSGYEYTQEYTQGYSCCITCAHKDECQTAKQPYIIGCSKYKEKI